MSGFLPRSCLNWHQIKKSDSAKVVLNILSNFYTGMETYETPTAQIYQNYDYFFPPSLAFLMTIYKGKQYHSELHKFEPLLHLKKCCKSWLNLLLKWFFPLKIRAPLRFSNFTSSTRELVLSGITPLSEMPQQLWALVVCHGIPLDSFSPLCGPIITC